MANEAQALFWGEEVGETWLAMQERRAEHATAHGHAAMDGARIGPGDRVLDVGCGSGDAAAELVRRVGPTGEVVLTDISPVLLDAARAAVSGLDNVSFIEADAQTHGFGPDFDVIFSQFGVMFFEDPVAAFANLRRSLRPGGRLGFSCWQSFFVNAWMRVPALAAMGIIPPATPPDPTAPGPFAFGDETRLRSILADAGFSQIEIVGNEVEANMKIGEADLANMLSFSLMRKEFAAADEATRQRVYVAAFDALAPFAQNGSYALPSASWIVSALTA
jgi:SAM-dependent methyltransferase